MRGGIMVTMDTLFSNITAFFEGKKKRVVIIVLAAVLLGGGWWYFSGNDTAYETVVAERRDVVLGVFVTGTVKPAEDAKLSFDASGRVGLVSVKVGDRVSAGKTLATLESAQTDTYARYLRAGANLAAEEAKLAEMRRGARPEEVAVSEAKAEKARATIAYEKNVVESALADGYIKTDDAIRNKADQMFSNPRTSSAVINIPVNDAQAKINIENTRVSLESQLNIWQTKGGNMGASDAHKTMNVAMMFLDTLSIAVNALTPGSSLSQTTIDSYKAAVLGARTNVQTADSALRTAEQGYDDAVLASRLADADLALVRAGSSTEALQGQEARVSAARADLASASADLSKASIRAPFSGLITKVGITRGESVIAGTPIITIVGEAAFEIEARVPETDIAHVAVGKEAGIILDAYGKTEPFNAEVFEVEPAETIVEGVPTYVIKLLLEDPKRLARSGMTADVTITADMRMGVIAIPSRAIKTENGGKTVRILHEDKTEEMRNVETGLRGSDGFTEITSGIAEGEQVITGEAK